MSDPVEVTVASPGYWSGRVHQLAALLASANPPSVIRDPTGAPPDPNQVVVLRGPAEWAAEPAALAAALAAVGESAAPSPSEPRTAAGATAPLGDRLVFTVEEAAKVLGISRSFAYEAVQRGDIPSMHIGRRILVPKAALNRMLEQAGGAPGGDVSG